MAWRAWFALAGRSAWNRRYNLALMVTAIALSTALLVGVERIRHQVRAGFSQSVSGTDLIVGARTSPSQLMLYTVFRLGSAPPNMSWDSVQRIAANPLVAWTVPVSLGDSHRGFPVLATTSDYFTHFRYGDARALVLARGKPFDKLFDTVLGADVARQLGYQPGDNIVLNHGADGPMALGHEHADKPFIVTGILAPTGTPVDRTVHIGLEAMEAIHLDWQGGAPVAGLSIPAEYAKKFDLTPKSVTGVLVGLNLRSRVFALQREIEAGKDAGRESRESLMAVLPGVALDELWQVVGMAEKGLLLMSGLVVAVGLAGLVSSLAAALGERRRELAILRAVGARPVDIMLLLTAEGFLLMVAGTATGYVLLTGAAVLFAPWLEATIGIALPVAWPHASELPLLGGLIAAGTLAALVPAWRAYRISLHDGLAPKI